MEGLDHGPLSVLRIGDEITAETLQAKQRRSNVNLGEVVNLTVRSLHVGAGTMVILANLMPIHIAGI